MRKNLIGFFDAKLHLKTSESQALAMEKYEQTRRGKTVRITMRYTWASIINIAEVWKGTATAMEKFTSKRGFSIWNR